VNLAASNTVNDLCNLGFDFTTIVQSDDYSRADLDLLSHYVAGRTSIIWAGFVEAVMLGVGLSAGADNWWERPREI